MTDDERRPNGAAITEAGQAIADYSIALADVLDVLDYRGDEFVAVCHEPPGGLFASVVRSPGDASERVAQLGNAVNVWFGVNPTAGPARDGGGRGTAVQVTRLAAAYADLDVKPGGCRDVATAEAIIDELSSVVGQRPSIVVHSGHGLQPYWPIDDGAISDEFPTADAAALLTRFGRLAAAVAERHGAAVDSVFDLARVLRVPGSINLKAEPVPVTGRRDSGGPLGRAELDDRLTEHGIDAQTDDASTGEVLSDPGGWAFATGTCGYVRAWLDAMATDGPRPGGGRNPWACSQAVRLFCALRLGCLSEADFRRAATQLESQLAILLATTEPRRALRTYEMRDIARLGQRRAACKTDDEARAELGGHAHGFWGASAPTGGAALEVTTNGATGDTVVTLGESSSVIDRLARNGAWLDEQHFDALQYAVDGIIPEGVEVLAAPPKKGKSFLVADIGLAVAAGGLALGAIRVTRRPVLYLALEDGYRRLQSRSRRLLKGGAIPAGIEFITEATPTEAGTAVAEFVERHRDDAPLIILDTLAKVRPPKQRGSDVYALDYAVGTELKRLAAVAPGSTLLVVHHTRKAEAADVLDTVSGSYGITGAVDFVLILDRKRHANDAVLHVTGRDVTEAEYALTADEGILWRLDGGDLTAARAGVEHRRAEAALGDRQQDVLRFVEQASGVVTATDVATGLPGIDGDTAGRYLRRLVDGGWITRVGRGQYLKRVSEVSEVSEVDGSSTPVSEVSEVSVSDGKPDQTAI